MADWMTAGRRREGQDFVDAGGSKVEEECAYVAMTSALQSKFPERGRNFLVEPDASAGVFLGRERNSEIGRQ